MRKFGKGKGKSGGANYKKGGSNSSNLALFRNAVNIGGKRPLAYFLCNGPHKVVECPQRAAFNVTQATTKGQGVKNEDYERKEEEPP